MPEKNISIQLVRTVLTEPLLSKVVAASGQMLKIVIDVNQDYYLGRDEAFKAVIALAREAMGGEAPAGVELPA